MAIDMLNRVLRPTRQQIDRWFRVVKHCKPAPHDKNLLEINNLSPESSASEYCRIIDAFISGDIGERDFHSAFSRVGKIRSYKDKEGAGHVSN